MTEAPAPEVQGHALDLDAYLDRVGVGGDLPPTRATLARLHRAHVDAVGFENLDVVLGRGVELDLDVVQDKLVRRGRGGYCFEHATLFAAVLSRLGFGATKLLARVGPEDGPVRPRTHLLLRVATADEGDWIADVGYGLAILEPLALRDGAHATMGVWEHRLQEYTPGHWRLQTRQGDAFQTEHAFDLVEQHHVDVRVFNHFTATYPGSPFTQRLIAMRAEEDRRLRLLGRVLETLRPGEASAETLDGEGVVEALTERFRVRLTDEDRAAIAAL